MTTPDTESQIKEKPNHDVKETVCDVKLDKKPPEGPLDKFHIIYILFFFLGLVQFLPWTFFTTATEFWMYKFRNTSISETDSEFRTDLQAQFNASLLITLQTTEIIFLIIGLLYGRLIKVKTRMIAILCIMFGFFGTVTAFVKIDTDSWQAGFFGLIMVIIAGISAMDAIFSITMYTILSNFPQHYLDPYFTGGGLSRIFTSGLQIISLASGLSVQDSALVYFSIGLFVIALTLAVVISTGRNEFYLYHMKDFQEGQTEKTITFSEGVHLLKKIWSPLVMMALFLLSFDASPTSLVVSEGEGNGPWNDLYFIPTITYLLNAIGELIGRSIGFRFAPNISSTAWVILSAVRMVIFIPLFMLCNAQPRHHLPVVLPHDYQYIIITIVSSVSGGYFLSRCSYNIAGLVTSEELKGAYHVNMLFTGIEMGVLSVVSLGSVRLL